MGRKMTTRVEDLQPSDWFKEKWQEWQRDLQVWHVMHRDFKDPNKRAAMMAAKVMQELERNKNEKTNGKPFEIYTEKAVESIAEKLNEKTISMAVERVDEKNNQRIDDANDQVKNDKIVE